MRAVCSLFLCCTLLAVVGCGDSSVPVNGNVTFDGDPVPDVLVSFIPDGDGQYATARADAQGAFDSVSRRDGSEGLAPGDYKVTVSMVSTPPEDGEEISYEAPPPPPFPRKYMASATTDLEVTIAGDGPQTVELELTE